MPSKTILLTNQPCVCVMFNLFKNLLQFKRLNHSLAFSDFFVRIICVLTHVNLQYKTLRSYYFKTVSKSIKAKQQSVEYVCMIQHSHKESKQAKKKTNLVGFAPGFSCVFEFKFSFPFNFEKFLCYLRKDHHILFDQSKHL